MPDQVITFAVGQGPLVFLLLVALWSGAKTPPAWIFAGTHTTIIGLLRERIALLEKELADSKAVAAEWQRAYLANADLAKKAINERGP